jgi:uncharacterized membrane protein
MTSPNTTSDGRTPAGRMGRLLGAVLRGGVTVSTICLAAGLVLSAAGSLTAAAAFLLTAGLLVLFATPVARVVVSMLEYAAERDWLFVTLTAIVLLEIGVGVLAAFYGTRL